jgi:hypothetical protein
MMKQATRAPNQNRTQNHKTLATSSVLCTVGEAGSTTSRRKRGGSPGVACADDLKGVGPLGIGGRRDGCEGERMETEHSVVASVGLCACYTQSHLIFTRFEHETPQTKSLGIQARRLQCLTTALPLLPPSFQCLLPLPLSSSTTNLSSHPQSTTSVTHPAFTSSATASTSSTAPNAATSCFQRSFVTTVRCSMSGASSALIRGSSRLTLWERWCERCPVGRRFAKSCLNHLLFKQAFSFFHVL